MAPLIRMLGLRLYRTSGDNSVLYDHDLEVYISIMNFGLSKLVGKLHLHFCFMFSVMPYLIKMVSKFPRR